MMRCKINGNWYNEEQVDTALEAVRAVDPVLAFDIESNLAFEEE